MAYAGTADARNKTTQFGYDGYDLSSITDPLNRSVILRTDAIGRTVSSTDPLNQRSISNIDRVTSVIDTNNQSTGFGYDNNDNPTTVTDANSHSTQFAYDNRNAVTGKTDALNQSNSIVYDKEHRITQSTDRKNQQTSYTYDSLNRLRTVTYADNSTITHTYDNGNRVTLLADSTNGNIGFSYDNLDRVTQMTSPKGSISYTYDANGQRSSMTVAGQPTQSYTYDKVGRLTRIDQAAGAINNNQAQNIQFTYDDAGRLTKTTYANGITRDNSYDDAGQLTGITYKKADNSLIGDLAYTYDANGRRTKTSGSLAKTDLPDTISTASYDANNRLTTWGSQILNYDANGNLTSDGLKTYIWNARNQLIQIKDSTGTEVASFSYDALGRRQNKTINGVSTGFMYDGVNIVQELNGASPINNYISAGVDQVFVQQSGAGSSASSLTYLTDALGSTIRLTNATGDKVVDYSYDPYGNTKADAVINNSFQYTGRENDGNGLYYYRARYYSPATHRFISEDPIGLNGGINTYGYVGGSPMTFTDPLGLCAKQPENPKCKAPIMQPEITGVIGQMGKDLNIDPLFIMSTALQESGWDLGHVYGTNSSSNGKPLNNLFGATYAGGNNIAYSSVLASGQAWEANWGPYLKNKPATIAAYASALTSNPRHMYNANPKYPGELAKRYKQLLKAVDDCGVKF